MTGLERRQARRREPDAGEPGAVLQFRRGGECRVVNISHGGALVEGRVRLDPGRHVEVSLVARHGPLTLQALVVRASVSNVRADAVVYRTAIQFDRPTLV